MIALSYDNIILKILKLSIFWFALASFLVLMTLIIQYEVKRPSHFQSVKIDVTGKVNICANDPIIDRKLYEGL